MALTAATSSPLMLRIPSVFYTCFYIQYISALSVHALNQTNIFPKNWKGFGRTQRLPSNLIRHEKHMQNTLQQHLCVKYSHAFIHHIACVCIYIYIYVSVNVQSIIHIIFVNTCAGTRTNKKPKREEERTRGPEDQGTRGPEDEGTTGPQHQGTRGPRDPGPEEDQGIRHGTLQVLCAFKSLCCYSTPERGGKKNFTKISCSARKSKTQNFSRRRKFQNMSKT